MANIGKIPEKLSNAILELQAEGKSATFIAEWLKEKHDIDVVHQTVSYFLRSRKEERKEMARQAYSKAVSESANKDLKIVSSMIDSLSRCYTKLMDEGNVKEANNISKTALSYINFRASLSGIEHEKEQEDNNSEQLLQDLLEKLGK